MTPRVKALVCRPKVPSTGEKIAAAAEAQVGRSFKPDQDARCADFVSSMIFDSGVQAKQGGFRHAVFAREFGEMGAQRIAPSSIKRGDVLAFSNTWRKSADETDYTHVAIYVGEGMMIHRPTSKADYYPGSKPGEIIKESIDDYLKRKRGRLDASLVLGFRF